MIEECSAVLPVFGATQVLLFFAFKFSQELRMLQKAFAMVLAIAALTSLTGCGSTANHYVYASLPAANQIIAYRADPNSGVLTQIAGSPYTVGNGAHWLALHPSGKFLYAANPGQNENDISVFTIASDGVLSEASRTSVAPNASQPTILLMDPSGGFLYVANSGSNNISVFSIDSGSGALAQLPNSPFPLGVNPLNMQLTPSGNFLFVTIPDQLVGFSVSGGTLTLVNVTPTDGTNPNGLAIDPTGTYVYVANYSSNSVSIFTIASTSPLQEIPNSPINVGYVAPVALLVDAQGKFLYVANQGSSNVAVFSINATTHLPDIFSTSTTTGAFTTEGSPSFLVMDPSGKYLYVGNQGTSAGIQALKVSDGTLTSIATYGVGNTPTSIVVLGK
jgi:6-phosphogluconolactonase (cycloisomerase 2 family)